MSDMPSTESTERSGRAGGKYAKHIMVCVRERNLDSPKGSCGVCGGDQIRKDFADLLKSHGLKSTMRASKTHCLDACEMGAVVVIYPDDVWYVNVRREDVAHIFEASVLHDDVYAPRLATESTWKQLEALRSQGAQHHKSAKKDKKIKKK